MGERVVRKWEAVNIMRVGRYKKRSPDDTLKLDGRVVKKEKKYQKTYV